MTSPILAAERHVLHSDAYITDAILGNGEALDCFNQKLQDAAAIEAALDNLKVLQQLVAIEGMPTAQDKLDALARLNGSCCGNITDTLRHIADTVMPLIAASSSDNPNGDTTPPINPDGNNNPPA